MSACTSAGAAPAPSSFGPNAQAPIHRLPVVEMLDGFHWRADFTLVEGRVIYDYLATNAEAVPFSALAEKVAP